MNYNYLNRILPTCKRPSELFTDNTIIFCDLKKSKGILQRNGQSVFEHTMKVVDILRGTSTLAILCGLFHDLGKACVTTNDDSSSSKFPNHEIESSAIARRVLTEWGFDIVFINRLCRIVSSHMYDINCSTRNKTLRKFVTRVGSENIDEWFMLRIADSQSYSMSGEYYNRYVEPFYIAIMSYLDRQPKNNIIQIDPLNTGGIIQIEGSDDS